MNSHFRPVILCGGSGTRLWPLSREMYPKQLLSLVGERSLLQDTVLRLTGDDPPMLVCNEDHRFLVAEQLRAIGTTDAKIVLEPAGRNTAPAVAIAAEIAVQGGRDPILIVLPSDHIVLDPAAFSLALEDAIQLAQQDYLVTFGVVPGHPETGYGYIESGEKLDRGFKVERFVEKPDLATATAYVASGNHFWNSGMFVFKASRYLEELHRHRPDIGDATHASTLSVKADLDFVRVDESAFLACPAESIDYAVMEKAEKVAVIPLDAGWSDVGSWDSLWNASEKDENQNAIRGDVMVDAVSGSYIRAEHRLVSVIGVQNLVVIETADAVMVASQAEAQNVKRLVENLKSCERDERLVHRKVFRPWGFYEGVDAGPGFQVKRISVNPGAKLSLQKHAKRAEHWVVVSGTAEVTRDLETFLLEENQSTYIPIGMVHRLANPTDGPLEIIEVQSGAYLGEDDIVRFEDHYGRTDE